MWNRIWKRKWNKKEKIITACVVLALVGAMIAALVYISRKDYLVIRKPVFVSIMGEEYKYSGKTTLQWKKDRMYMENQDFSQPFFMDGIPVYQDDRQSLIVTDMMSYTNPDTHFIRRFSYFGRVFLEDGRCYLSTNGRKKMEMNGGYLFDGNNTVIFLEPVTVKVNDAPFQLEPLSYIYVKNQDYLYYYSAKDQKSGYLDYDQADLMAENERASWNLNLSRDLLLPADGKIQMLISDPEVLKPLQ